MALTKIDDRGLKTPIDLLDNEKVRLGTGNDLELFHDGSKSILKDSGTGWLEINTNNLRVQNAAANETLLYATENGSVELFYDNSKKLETTSVGVKLLGSGTDAIEMTGDVWFNNNEHAGKDIYFNSGDKHLIFEDEVKAKFGSNGDLQIYHDGSDSYIVDSGTGDLMIRSTDDLKLQNADGSESFLHCNDGGDVILYRAGNERIRTTNAGIAVSGSIDAGDNCKLLLGDGDDLQIDHSGTNSQIYHNGTGHLYIATLGTGEDIHHQSTGKMTFSTGGSERLRITDDGIKFNGDTAAANALDDYEEGTYTATIYGSSTGTGSPFGMNPSNLRYTKVGRLVTVTGRVYINSSSNNPTGSARMLLPFTSASNGTGHDGQGYSYVTRYNVYSPNSDWNLVFEVEPNSSYGGLLWCKPGAAWESATADGHINQNAAYYGFDFSYTVA